MSGIQQTLSMELILDFAWKALRGVYRTEVAAALRKVGTCYLCVLNSRAWWKMPEIDEDYSYPVEAKDMMTTAPVEIRRKFGLFATNYVFVDDATMQWNPTVDFQGREEE